MKVLITAAQFSSEISGIQRHALGLVKALLHQPSVREVHFVLAPWQRRFAQVEELNSGRVVLHFAEMNRGLVSRNLWHYRQLPHLIKEIAPDIVHLSYPIPIDHRSIETPIVLTLHDLYPFDIPQNFGFLKALFNRAMLHGCLSGVHAIACVSDATLDRLQRNLPHRIHGKASRIYNCVDPCNDCADQSPIPGDNGEPFLLSVSQHRSNKNVALLVEVFHKLIVRQIIASNAQLVVVGIEGPETRHIRQTIARLHLSQKVHLLHGLTDSQLQWCYRHCELVVAPSVIEGFGLPVVEALLAGCRVVCSDIPAFRETDPGQCTFAELNLYSRSNFVEAIASTVAEVRPAPMAFPQFSAAVVGEQYVELYRRLISEKLGVRRAEHLRSATSVCADQPWRTQREKLDAI